MSRTPEPLKPFPPLARLFKLYVALAFVITVLGLYLGQTFVLWFALGAAIGAAVWHSRGGGVTRAAPRVRAENDSVVIGYRRSAALTWAALATYLAVSFVAGVRLFEGLPVHQAFMAFTALLMAVPVPDLIRASVRRSEIRLTWAGMTISGWSTDAYLDWDDVELVDSDPRNPWAFRVLVRAKPGATSYRHRRRRILLPLEPWPQPEDIVLHGVSLDDPVSVMIFLKTLAVLPPHKRSDLLRSPNSVLFLTRQLDVVELLSTVA